MKIQIYYYNFIGIINIYNAVSTAPSPTATDNLRYSSNDQLFRAKNQMEAA
ncbi:MAG: hypothetical protein IPL95_10465 [Saprospiraceae bacterium]|nr:hypothetical protein [Saprospiraceae bacterium]